MEYVFLRQPLPAVFLRRKQPALPDMADMGAPGFRKRRSPCPLKTITAIGAAVLLFCSCAQVQTGFIAPAPDETVRSRIETVQAQTRWGQELEPDILDQSRALPQTAAILTPRNMATLPKAGKTPIYPEIPGFGSLDTSGLEAGQAACVQAFCKGLTGESPGIDPALMQSDKQFMRILFLYEISTLPAFASFIIGKPIITEQNYMTPVRLLSRDKNTYADVKIFLEKDNSAEGGGKWLIQQLILEEQHDG